MAAELVDPLSILVAFRCLHGMGATDSRSLRSDSFVRIKHFELLLFLFGVFWG
jgi:hypothetical protein